MMWSRKVMSCLLQLLFTVSDTWTNSKHQTEKISRSPLQPDKLQGISASYSLCFVCFAFLLSFVMLGLFFSPFFGRGNNLRQELAKLKQLAFSFQLSPSKKKNKNKKENKRNSSICSPRSESWHSSTDWPLNSRHRSISSPLHAHAPSPNQLGS